MASQWSMLFRAHVTAIIYFAAGTVKVFPALLSVNRRRTAKQSQSLTSVGVHYLLIVEHPAPTSQEQDRSGHITVMALPASRVG